MSAESDIKLEGKQVIVDAWDLALDSQDRRKTDTAQRRALVHDQGDALTINYAGDYPGGVRMFGADSKSQLSLDSICMIRARNNKAVVGVGWLGNNVLLAAEQVTLKAADLILDNQGVEEKASTNVALSHQSGDKLVFNRGGGYKGGVEIEGCKKASISVGYAGGSTVVMRAEKVALAAADLILDNKGVQEDPSRTNVALSHQSGDKLVLNRGGGYKGGVEVEGYVRFGGNVSAKEIHPSKIQVGRDNRFTPTRESYITIENDSIIAHNIPNTSPQTGGPIRPRPITIDIDLIKEVLKMRDEIKELKKQVKAL